MKEQPVYLAAHKGLYGQAVGKPGEIVIDWAQEFLSADPAPNLWEQQLCPELEQHLRTFRSDQTNLIKLRAFARNSAGLAFGCVFSQRAGFQIHYADNRSDLWRSDADDADPPLIRRDTALYKDGRDLVLELAITQGAASVTPPVNHWLGHSGTLDRAKFRQLLISVFNEGELRDHCFDLSVDYESLPGSGKSDKVRELMAYMERTTRIDELLDRCWHDRPHHPWHEVKPLVRKRLLLALDREDPTFTAAEGAMIARKVCKLVRDEGMPGGTVHLFGALPFGVALLIGWGLQAGRSVQCYELDQDQHYQPTCLLRT
jgi:Effector-associated domain 7/SMODS-associated and fused to various effectors sensor domain